MFKVKRCSICKQKYEGYGNNAQPVNKGKCCDKCNREVVIPVRIAIATRVPKDKINL